jgi:anti-sigma factor RsiW
MSCARTRQLLDALVDSELDPATTDEIGRHIAICPACAALRAEREALTAQIRSGAPRFAASPEFARKICAQLQSPEARAVPPRGRAGPTWMQAMALGGMAAGAAVLTTYWLLRIAPEDAVREQAVNRHVAALTVARANPASLVEVSSTDRHEVKPWFEGRIDFSPPVRDLDRQGFKLIGGRVDQTGNERVAALVYRIRQHTVELFVSRAGTDAVEAPHSAMLRGFGVVTWTEGGMRFAAVSDVDPHDLARFADAVRAPS